MFRVSPLGYLTRVVLLAALTGGATAATAQLPSYCRAAPVGDDPGTSLRAGLDNPFRSSRADTIVSIVRALQSSALPQERAAVRAAIEGLWREDPAGVERALAALIAGGGQDLELAGTALDVTIAAYRRLSGRSRPLILAATLGGAAHRRTAVLRAIKPPVAPSEMAIMRRWTCGSLAALLAASHPAAREFSYLEPGDMQRHARLIATVAVLLGDSAGPELGRAMRAVAPQFGLPAYVDDARALLAGEE